MSLVHMYLRQVSNSPTTAEYVAVTADVPGCNDWREVARIRINKAEKTYDVAPLNEWVTEKVIPPQLYDLPDAELASLIRERYADHGWGAWSSRINLWVKGMLSQNLFPSRAPLPLGDSD